MSKKSFKPLIVLGSIAAGALVYESCRKTKKSQKTKKIKKWISREVEFKENMSDLEKAKLINETERQIIESLYKQEWPGLIIKSIRFSIAPSIDGNHMHICAKIVLRYLKEGRQGSEPEDDGPKKPISYT